MSNEESKPEELSGIAQTKAAETKLKIIWNDKNITISSKIRLMRFLEAENHEEWRKLVVEATVVPQRFTRQRDR